VNDVNFIFFFLNGKPLPYGLNPIRSMDRLLVNFMRSPDTINLELLTEVKLKLEYCASLLDQLENNRKTTQFRDWYKNDYYLSL
jgi:hypothetical protein